MPGVRQHFVPEFLIRRFTPDRSDKGGLVYRLDLAEKRGQTRRANPKNEAVRHRYYRITGDDGTVDDTADQFIDRVESHAAEAVARIVDAPRAFPGGNDRFFLSLFIALQKSRTPEGRKQIREADLELARMHAEVVLSAPEAGAPESEAETRERLALLDDLATGKLGFEAPPSREVALMFASLMPVSESLMDQMAWTAITAPPGASFVLSDHPVCHYDPTPKMAGAGAGFQSSAGSKTVVPIDRTTVLMLEPAPSFRWHCVRATTVGVDMINLLVYAQAQQCVWGIDQETVTRLHRIARKRRAVVRQFMPRPPRIWVTEDAPSALAVPATFRSRTPDGDLLSRAMIFPGAGDRPVEDVQPRRAE